MRGPERPPMFTSAVTLLVVGVAAAATCSCAMSHQLDDGSFACRDDVPSPVESEVCTPELQAVCQRWAQGRTSHGHARSACRLNETGPCWNGDHECDWSVGGGPIHVECSCGDRSCRDNEVCVSDTPTAASHCVTSCGYEIGSAPTCANACARRNACLHAIAVDCATSCSTEWGLASAAGCGPQYDAYFACLGATARRDLCPPRSTIEPPCRAAEIGLRSCETDYCRCDASTPACVGSCAGHDAGS